MADVVKKRVLTLKSKLGFGKYEFITLQDIINLGKKQYLRWVYYNYENIDYQEEVMSIIQLPVEYRITKPGKNPDKLLILDKEICLSEKKYVILNKADKHRNMVDKSKYSYEKNILQDKVSLLLVNHGHRKF